MDDNRCWLGKRTNSAGTSVGMCTWLVRIDRSEFIRLDAARLQRDTRFAPRRAAVTSEYAPAALRSIAYAGEARSVRSDEGEVATRSDGRQRSVRDGAK
jgi:hypothetical protein